MRADHRNECVSIYRKDTEPFISFFYLLTLYKENHSFIKMAGVDIGIANTIIIDIDTQSQLRRFVLTNWSYIITIIRLNGKMLNQKVHQVVSVLDHRNETILKKLKS